MTMKCGCFKTGSTSSKCFSEIVLQGSVYLSRLEWSIFDVTDWYKTGVLLYGRYGCVFDVVQAMDTLMK
jgi:hypothetical protein